jgi:anti-anti-sigma regulatory factor
MLDYRPLVIRLQDAEWDLSTSGKLQFLLAAATDRLRVYIDLSVVTYLDAACLGKFARMQQKRVCKAGFEPAAFIIANPLIRRLFQLVRFDEVWPIFGSIDDALADDSPPHDDRGYRPAV